MYGLLKWLIADGQLCRGWLGRWVYVVVYANYKVTKIWSFSSIGGELCKWITVVLFRLHVVYEVLYYNLRRLILVVYTAFKI